MEMIVWELCEHGETKSHIYWKPGWLLPDYRLCLGGRERTFRRDRGWLKSRPSTERDVFVWVEVSDV